MVQRVERIPAASELCALKGGFSEHPQFMDVFWLKETCGFVGSELLRTG